MGRSKNKLVSPILNTEMCFDFGLWTKNCGNYSGDKACMFAIGYSCRKKTIETHHH